MGKVGAMKEFYSGIGVQMYDMMRLNVQIGPYIKEVG